MRSILHRRITVPVAILATVGLALTGCSSGGGGGSADSGPGDAGEADGVVTMYGTIIDTEEELLNESWAAWEEESGIDIQYESSKEFEAQITIRAQGGNAPDLAIFPQPGLLGDLASRDYIQPAPEGVADNVGEYWTDDWAAYATTDDTLFGAPLMASVKGYVWYHPADFAEWGVEVPETWDELLELTATIQETTGVAPWCAGFDSDAASGWPGTDWVEDLVLRQAGPEVYDQWVNHEIPFDDPAIAEAFDSVGEILLNPDYVNAGYGGVESINSNTFQDVARVIGDGTCALHHQASFYDGFLTDPTNGNTSVGPEEDVWAFLLPPVEADSGQAVTGGGEIVAAFSNDEDTIAVQEYLSSPEWANSRVALGGVISANNGLDPSNASSPVLQDAIGILTDENTTFRFDASDLMPGVVGSGSFFTGIVDWINGKATEDVLSTIESSWPSE
ncbi:carbohydrate ABC transporter substrate-binding protein (CUT1 family) [Glaciihabitans tibetensis]|uniref:Carbohydrate ABC transporter substrate-binding protein (CUT1 family) n=1 Tax=Glaciihabitans tibetensis TaxID=1266600 RepID=A0A2T0V709_9MICO|nr:ABC transporter substrate-binding protein [Glaciihabitans tibetensis]PRY65975.1 carbohydrate ABC transporter substrate-binding protein (CUT1 family) [Glaciihabitans tibetensis]